MDEHSRIEALITQAADHPSLPESRDLLRDAAQQADAAGEEELAYRARMHLTATANMLEDSETMMSSFGWCVVHHDSDPVRFPIDPGVPADLLFQFKWITSCVAANSMFDIERVTQVLSDMERRYIEAGIGLAGVRQAQHSAAALLGDMDAAARYLSDRDTHPVDDYAHCAACAHSLDASFFQATGDDATALRLWEEMHEQDMVCGKEPEWADADALMPLLRAGRLEEATATHLRGYRMLRRNHGPFSQVALHLEFCAVTGNLARGLALLERHLPDLASDPLSEASQLSGLISMGVLLEALCEAGQGAAIVRGSDDSAFAPLWGEAAEPLSVEQLVQRVWPAVDRIAERFDRRNGNSWYSRRVGERRAAGALRVDLPLDVPAFQPPTETAQPLGEPSTALEWLQRARFVLENSRSLVTAAEAARRGLEHDDPVVAPELWKVLIWADLAADDQALASEHHRERIAALRRAGRDDQADVEARIGLALLGPAGDDEIEQFRDELAIAERENRDPSLRADLLASIASGLDFDEDPGEALKLLGEAAALVAQDDPQFIRLFIVQNQGSILLRAGRAEEALAVLDAAQRDPRNAGWSLPIVRRMRAQALAATGQLEEALSEADLLLSEQMALGDSIAIADTAQLSGMLLEDLGRAEESIARLEFALRCAERAEQNTIGQRYFLAGVQLRAGHFDIALENYETVYLAEKNAEAPPQAIAETALQLGRAAFPAGEPGMAYRSWMEAVELAEQAEAWELATEAGSALGSLLLQFDDEDAVGVLEKALEHARRSGQPIAEADVRHGLGRARVASGDDAGLADLDIAIELGRAEGAEWFAANVLDSKGRCLVDLGRLDDGVAALLAAADALAAAGDVMTAVSGEVYAARGLAAENRAEEAVSILQGSRDRIPEGSPQYGGLTLELAAMLDAVGRTSEAAALRASVA